MPVRLDRGSAAGDLAVTVEAMMNQGADVLKATMEAIATPAA